MLFAAYRKDHSNQFVKIIFFPEIDWCSIVNGLKSLTFFELLLNEARSYGSDFLEICSKLGEINVSNITYANSTIASKFPSGDYRFDHRFFNDVDENIYNITIYAHFVHYN